MLKLNNLKPNKGSSHRKKRVGRGDSSGWGTTAGRGSKGQKSRTGALHGKIGFEGGQMPLQRRLPKFGFKNPFRKEFVVVNLTTINKLPNTETITPTLLVKYGIIKSQDINAIKILGNGEINKPYTIKAHKFSKSAQQKIEAAGGKVEVI